MIKINRYTKLNEDEWLLIKKSKPLFDSNIKECIGILRDYNNKTSLSGCIKKYYYNHINNKVTEFNDYLVFCWYKKGFIVLSKTAFENTLENGSEIGYVDIFKLNKKEIDKFQLYVTKCKILDNLSSSDRWAYKL